LKNKRFLAFVIALVVAFTSGFLLEVRAETNVSVVLDGNSLSFDVAPQIINDRVMVPFRGIAEAIGAGVSWDQESGRIIMTLGSNFTWMHVGDPTVEYGLLGEHAPGVPSIKLVGLFEMDSPPIIVNGRTLVPIRAISESFGAEVEWNPETSTVTITTP